MADPRLEAELAAHEGSGRGVRRGGVPARPAPRSRRRGARASAREARRGNALARDARPRARDERRVRARPRARRRGRARPRSARSATSGSAGSRRPQERTSASSRSRGCSRACATSGRVLEVGYAFAETAYLAALLRSGVELVGVDLATTRRRRDGDRRAPTSASSRSRTRRSTRCCSSRRSSTSAPTTRCTGSTARVGRRTRALDALRELRRVLRGDGSLLVTVPLGEPGDHGWFRQEDERGWTRLYAAAGLLRRGAARRTSCTPEGWRAAPALRRRRAFATETRGPAASAVLCAELSPGPAAPIS